MNRHLISRLSILKKMSQTDLIQKMKRQVLCVLSLIIILGSLCPTAVPAKDEVPAQNKESRNRTVRVGWYESTFCYIDQFGRRCGIDFEYQQKISKYNGWEYEYVEGSWSNLLQMLTDGKIDLLSDVSYTEERKDVMLFSDLPMGEESYYIYIDADNRYITSDDLKTVNGKKLGVNKGSVQEGFLRDWAQRNGLAPEIVPLTCEESESMDMIARGDIDGYVTTNTFGAKEKLIPLCKVGASSFYYAVNKDRPDLLADLNRALINIQDEDPYFNQKMYEEHIYITQTNAFLTPAQEEWIRKHGTVRVGYRDNYLPFCANDKETGELTGALRDYLAHAANNLKNADINFAAVPYASTKDAIEALKTGEVDCIFPINITSYDAYEMGIRASNPVMKTEMNAIMRAEDDSSLSRDSEFIVANNSGNINSETFIRQYFPECTTVNYDTFQTCIEAIREGKADCALVSNYRQNDMEPVLEQNGLFFVPTGESMNLSFAVNRDSRELLSVLNKTAVLTSSENVDSLLAAYSHSSKKMTAGQFLKENWLAVMTLITAAFAVIIILLLQKLKAERSLNEQRKKTEEALRIAELKQSLTSLLDNMPVMTFSKDCETKEYLACNQSFAKYCNKSTPEEVVGLTAHHIFDKKTADHFVADDERALEMDEPHVYFEDVPDALGNPCRFQTTKLKFYDETGRLCILGMSLDFTEEERIRKESEKNKAAYQEALSNSEIYSNIIASLSGDYFDLFYVDLQTDDYIEYGSRTVKEKLEEEKHGRDFFTSGRKDAEDIVYKEDLDEFLKVFEKEHLLNEIKRHGTYIIYYRLMVDGVPSYASMKMTLVGEDKRYLIIGVNDVDSQIKDRKAAEHAKEERRSYERLNALNGNIIVLYIVDPVTGRYTEFSSTKVFDDLGIEKQGDDWFETTYENSRRVLHPEDQEMFRTLVTRENIMNSIRQDNVFILDYRLMSEGLPSYVRLKAARLEEDGREMLIIGLLDVDAQTRREQKYAADLSDARMMASVDALTGVKNKYAYLQWEEKIDEQIGNGEQEPFAVVVCDINNMKTVNDLYGHNEGDECIRRASERICGIFEHSPVFRVGGDEFVVLLTGKDYEHREELMEQMNEIPRERSLHKVGDIISAGMVEYRKDKNFSLLSVFEAADMAMYERKQYLKGKDK